MLDTLTFVSIFAGFVLILVVGAKLGAGSTDSVHGIFVLPAMPARPRGVQEEDLPPFVFRDARTIVSTGAAAQATVDRVFETYAA